MAGTIESAYQSHGKNVPANLLANTKRITNEPVEQKQQSAEPLTFNSQNDALAARKAGKIKAGDRIVVNGVSGTWSDN